MTKYIILSMAVIFIILLVAIYHQEQCEGTVCRGYYYEITEICDEYEQEYATFDRISELTGKGYFCRVDEDLFVCKKCI